MLLRSICYKAEALNLSKKYMIIKINLRGCTYGSAIFLATPMTKSISRILIRYVLENILADLNPNNE